MAWAPEIEEVAAADLKPHPRNSRTHTSAQIDAIAKSLEKFGMVQPVVADEGGTILVGHARYEAACRLEWETLPVIRRRGLSGDQKRALIISDNRLGEQGSGWDRKALDEELRDLVGAKVDVTLSGFDLGDISALMRPEAPKPQEDDLPAERPEGEEPRAKPGDLWILGRHRIVCGDSTDKAAVEALLQGDKPRLMVTDPPYGVNYDAEWRNKALGGTGAATGKVTNDDRADWREAWALFPGDTAYVWHGALHGPEVLESLRAAGFKSKGMVVWAKPSLAISRGHYHWQHEPALYMTRRRGLPWRGGSSQTTVWDISHRRSGSGHSTQKPIEAMRRPILSHLKEGELVYDPFLGSGTTLIAAETSNRTARGIEFEPKYIETTIRRWQAMTGQEAEHGETGERFGT